MSGPTDFVAAQAANRRNTLLLLVLLTILAAVTGYVVGWLLQSEVVDHVPVVSEVGLLGAGLMAVASIGWSAISLGFGDRLVLAMAEARPIDKPDAPQLYNVVEEMSLAAGVPMPRVMILETEVPNAFATGTKPGHGTIAVTRGLLDKMNRDELQGVVAHEMAHVANLDTRYMVVVGVTVGLIALVCDLILRTMRWGDFSGRRRDGDDKRSGSGSGAGLLILLLIVVAVLAPLAAKAVQMAVSRQREYLADATSVQFTRNPDGLISALTKLAAAAGPFPGVSRATQHLFIVNPVQPMTSRTPALLATHPDIADRIARLRNLGA
ncbi:M48 family metallopeptidase [Enhydrobacter sp.]|jgi:heat shock protein HtpX|uniref:M48 family metallopeptidase n=1 Tax=Enhydrobacter sp. TaxID=1894999 RepID=UPI00262BB89E|nr:M48 family metallopeptidase [Enhydrobacter sp.]WIM10988.1 MAG: Heat shock protein HtpX [Enhydrobacter sp.]